MSATHGFTSAEGWLQWFTTTQQAACRTYLCTRYHLNSLDAEALINAAQLQVFLHWETVEHPLAYFWHTLQRAVLKHGYRCIYERRQLAVYAQQHQADTHSAERTARHVEDVLERVFPRQRQLLEWFLQGYSDAQVATWLQTTLQAVRVARHRVYRNLQSQLHPRGRRRSEGSRRHASRRE